MLLTSPTHFLVLDIVALILQFMGIVCNAFFIFMFIRIAKMRSNPSLLPLMFLVITHFLHAVLTVPYMVYLTVKWNPWYINLDPTFTLISSLPLAAQIKINIILSISMALERTVALYFPLTYRTLPLKLYSTVWFIISITFAVIDVTVEMMLTPFKEVPNCAAMGCFLTGVFLIYWGTSNTVLSFIVIFLTILVMIKLKVLIRQSSRRAGKNKTRTLDQANRHSLGNLLSSVVFVTLPSAATGILKLAGVSAFKDVGAFYSIGMLSAGVFNCLIYAAVNKEGRSLMRQAISRKPIYPQRNPSVASIKFSRSTNK